jgi:hypothetical protein
MKSIDIFPVTIFEDYLEVPNELIKGIKKEIDNDKSVYTTPIGWDGGVLSSFGTQSDLLYGKNYVETLIDKVLYIQQNHPAYDVFGKKYKFNYEIWWNYYTKGKFQEYHHHPNEIISGVWYLTDSDSNTVFCERGQKHKVLSEKGKIIVFPSWLAHYVEPTLNERITISFNCNFSGRNF